MSESTHGDEAILGPLINRCGKMRMLSHRVVVTLLLANDNASASETSRERLAQDLNEFAQIAADILPGSRDSKLPTSLKRILEHVEAVTPSQSETIGKFIVNGRLIEDRLASGDSAHLSKSIRELADFVSTPLLAALNGIVDGVNKALDHVVSSRESQAGSQSKMIRSSISELEKISRMIMIISVNASIEASRVGEAGRGFSAVAGDIRGLSQSTNKVITSLRAQYERNELA